MKFNDDRVGIEKTKKLTGGNLASDRSMGGFVEVPNLLPQRALQHRLPYGPGSPNCRNTNAHIPDIGHHEPSDEEVDKVESEVVDLCLEFRWIDTSGGEGIELCRKPAKDDAHQWKGSAGRDGCEYCDCEQYGIQAVGVGEYALFGKISFTFEDERGRCDGGH